MPVCGLSRVISQTIVCARVTGVDLILIWNEGRAVQTAKSLTEGVGLVIDIEVGIQRQLAARTGSPQQHLVGFGRLPGLQEGVVVEPEIARLQVAFALPLSCSHLSSI